MSWVKLDDGMPDSLKIAPLSDAAFRAYVTSICYAARSLSDGFIPMKKAKEIAGRTRVIQELMPSLWENAEGGFMVHDYLQYNPTRETVLAEREKAKGRMNAVRSANVRPNIARSSPSPYPYPSPSRPNEIKESHREEEVVLPRRNVFVLFDQFMGSPSVTGLMRDVLIQAEEEYGETCVTHCFEEAAKSSNGTRSWKFVEAILKRHKREGCDDKRARANNGQPRKPTRSNNGDRDRAAEARAVLAGR